MSLPANSLIYQYMLGRAKDASITNHPGQVLTKLLQANWEILRQEGVSHIYLTGLFDSTGPIIASIEESVDLTTGIRIPSAFAISDHQAINPLLGSKDDAVQLINHFHAQQLKVIVDFVPNHTSTVHPWVEQHPEYYTKVDDQFVKEFSQDVYKLNYENPALRSEMIKVIESIATLGVDGIRVDMAHLIPQFFWQQSIAHLKKTHPNFIWIAESYETSPFDHSHTHELLDAGFDAIYDQYTYENSRSFATNHDSLDHLVAHLNYKLENNTKQSLTYLMNHDENLAVPTSLQPALLSLIALMPSPLLIFNGQILGRSQRLAHHRYDELSDAQSELKNKTPDWFHNLMMIKKSLQPRLSKVEQVAPNVLVGHLTIENHNAHIIANLSQNDYTLPTDRYKFPGISAKIDATESLPSGYAEICFLKQ